MRFDVKGPPKKLQTWILRLPGREVLHFKEAVVNDDTESFYNSIRESRYEVHQTLYEAKDDKQALVLIGQEDVSEQAYVDYIDGQMQPENWGTYLGGSGANIIDIFAEKAKKAIFICVPSKYPTETTPGELKVYHLHKPKDAKCSGLALYYKEKSHFNTLIPDDAKEFEATFGVSAQPWSDENLQKRKRESQIINDKIPFRTGQYMANQKKVGGFPPITKSEIDKAKSAIKENTATSHDYLVLAKLEFNENKNGCIELATKSIKKDRTQVEAYWKRGSCYFLQGKYVFALNDYIYAYNLLKNQLINLEDKDRAKILETAQLLELCADQIKKTKPYLTADHKNFRIEWFNHLSVSSDPIIETHSETATIEAKGELKSIDKKQDEKKQDEKKATDPTPDDKSKIDERNVATIAALAGNYERSVRIFKNVAPTLDDTNFEKFCKDWLEVVQEYCKPNDFIAAQITVKETKDYRTTPSMMPPPLNLSRCSSPDLESGTRSRADSDSSLGSSRSGSPVRPAGTIPSFRPLPLGMISSRSGSPVRSSRTTPSFEPLPLAMISCRSGSPKRNETPKTPVTPDIQKVNLTPSSSPSHRTVTTPHLPSIQEQEYREIKKGKSGESGKAIIESKLTGFLKKMSKGCYLEPKFSLPEGSPYEGQFKLVAEYLDKKNYTQALEVCNDSIQELEVELQSGVKKTNALDLYSLIIYFRLCRTTIYESQLNDHPIDDYTLSNYKSDIDDIDDAIQRVEDFDCKVDFTWKQMPLLKLALYHVLSSKYGEACKILTNLCEKYPTMNKEVIRQFILNRIPEKERRSNGDLFSFELYLSKKSPHKRTESISQTNPRIEDKRSSQTPDHSPKHRSYVSIPPFSRSLTSDWALPPSAQTLAQSSALPITIQFRLTNYSMTIKILFVDQTSELRNHRELFNYIRELHPYIKALPKIPALIQRIENEIQTLKSKKYAHTMNGTDAAILVGYLINLGLINGKIRQYLAASNTTAEPVVPVEMLNHYLQDALKYFQDAKELIIKFNLPKEWSQTVDLLSMVCYTDLNDPKAIECFKPHDDPVSTDPTIIFCRHYLKSLDLNNPSKKEIKAQPQPARETSENQSIWNFSPAQSTDGSPAPESTHIDQDDIAYTVEYFKSPSKEDIIHLKENLKKYINRNDIDRCLEIMLRMKDLGLSIRTIFSVVSSSPIRSKLLSLYRRRLDILMYSPERQISMLLNNKTDIDPFDHLLELTEQFKRYKEAVHEKTIRSKGEKSSELASDYIKLKKEREQLTQEVSRFVSLLENSKSYNESMGYKIEILLEKCEDLGLECTSKVYLRLLLIYLNSKRFDEFFELTKKYVEKDVIAQTAKNYIRDYDFYHDVEKHIDWQYYDILKILLDEIPNEVNRQIILYHLQIYGNFIQSLSPTAGIPKDRFHIIRYILKGLQRYSARSLKTFNILSEIPPVFDQVIQSTVSAKDVKVIGVDFKYPENASSQSLRDFILRMSFARLSREPISIQKNDFIGFPFYQNKTATAPLTTLFSEFDLCEKSINIHCFQNLTQKVEIDQRNQSIELLFAIKLLAKRLNKTSKSVIDVKNDEFLQFLTLGNYNPRPSFKGYRLNEAQFEEMWGPATPISITEMQRIEREHKILGVKLTLEGDNKTGSNISISIPYLSIIGLLIPYLDRKLRTPTLSIKTDLKKTLIDKDIINVITQYIYPNILSPADCKLSLLSKNPGISYFKDFEQIANQYDLGKASKDDALKVYHECANYIYFLGVDTGKWISNIENDLKSRGITPDKEIVAKIMVYLNHLFRLGYKLQAEYLRDNPALPQINIGIRVTQEILDSLGIDKGSCDDVFVCDYEFQKQTILSKEPKQDLQSEIKEAKELELAPPIAGDTQGKPKISIDKQKPSQSIVMFGSPFYLPPAARETEVTSRLRGGASSTGDSDADDSIDEDDIITSVRPRKINEKKESKYKDSKISHSPDDSENLGQLNLQS